MCSDLLRLLDQSQWLVTTERIAVLRPALGALTGERTVVRPYRDEDAAAMYEAVAESRDHLRQFFPWYNDFGAGADALTLAMSHRVGEFGWLK